MLEIHHLHKHTTGLSQFTAEKKETYCHPEFASEKESCPSPLPGWEHAQAKSVQAFQDRDILFARTVPNSHRRLRAKAVLSSVGAAGLQQV